MLEKIIYLYSCLSLKKNVVTLIAVIDTHTKLSVGEPILPPTKKLE